MKKIAFCLALAMSAVVINTNAVTQVSIIESQGSIEIKIKNDTDDEFRVVTENGGHYNLTKGATTTIKLDEGDWLYTEKNGNRGDKLIQATADNDGKVFNLSKLL